MSKFRKPQVVGGAERYDNLHPLTIKTFEGPITASHGDWISPVITGEKYPWMPKITTVGQSASLRLGRNKSRQRRRVPRRKRRSCGGEPRVSASLRRRHAKGKRIEAIQAGSATYRAAIFNCCGESNKVLATGADQDTAVKAAITAIPGSDWKNFRDGEIAETVHCMNTTGKAFRLIVLRRPREQDLFEDKGPHGYHAIASNRADEDAVTTMECYCKRGDESRKPRSKNLKIDSSMEFMPARTFQANAAFFANGVMTYNLYLGFRGVAQGKGVGACASADRALASVSYGGQDRPPWPANTLEDRRRHAGRVHCYLRVLRARHAERRRRSRNIAIAGAAFSHSWRQTTSRRWASHAQDTKTPELPV